MASARHTTVTLAKYVGTLVLGGIAGAGIYTGTIGGGSTTVIRTNYQVVSSGGLLNHYGTLTEDDRVARGGTQTGWVLQNDFDDQILVKQITLNVTTAGEATCVDVFRGTGSITDSSVLTGSTIASKLCLSTGVRTLSGAFSQTSGNFLLDERGGLNDHILFISSNPEAGSGTVFKYHIEGHQF